MGEVWDLTTEEGWATYQIAIGVPFRDDGQLILDLANPDGQAELAKVHKRAKSGPSPATRFYWMMERMGLPVPVREHCFAKPRRWRFDYAYPDLKLAFEVDGGTWIHTKDTGQGSYSGGHGHPVRFETDAEKFNAALMLGWAVYHVTTKMIDSGTAQALLNQLCEAGLLPETE